MKRFIALLLAVLALASLAACGGTAAPADSGTANTNPASTGTESQSSVVVQDSTDTEVAQVENNTEKSDETLRIVMAGEPASLMNEMTAGSYSTYVRSLFADRLLNYDESTGEFGPYLVESWEQIDETHLRCTLHKGITADDGTELHASDVIFSLNLGLELCPIFMPNDWNVPACVAEDDYTFVLELAEGKSMMGAMANMCLAINCIYDESSLEAAGGVEANRTNPHWGTGKYKFVEWVPGQYILLERNEDYWDESYVGYYKYIRFTFVSDSATRLMSILSNDADMAPNVALGQAVEFMGNDGCQVIAIGKADVAGFSVNCANDSPLAKDVRVRQAIRMALNIDALNQIATSGLGQREDFFIKSTSKYFTDPTGGAGVPYDVEGAKALLAEAGYPDGFELDLLGGATDEEVLTAVQGMLLEIGVKVNLIIQDTPVMLEDGQAGNYDLLYQSHPGALYYRGFDTFNILDPATAGAGKYAGGPKLTDPALTDLIVTAIGPDEAAAVEAINTIQQMAYDEVWWIGVHSAINTDVAANGLTGFRLVLGTYDFSQIRPAQ